MDKPGWHKHKPLLGVRVLVTRARSQAGSLAERIAELGGEPCELPVIEIAPAQGAEEERALLAVLRQAESYDWLFFTSANAVDYFWEGLARSGGSVESFHRAKIAAVGPKTGAALRSRGLRHEALPTEFQAEGMLEHLGTQLKPGQRALLPRGNLARDTLALELASRGVAADVVIVYETRIPEQPNAAALEYLRRGAVDVVTFTSSSTITNLLAILRGDGAADPLQLLLRCEIACIGPATAETAVAAGLEPAIVPEQATVESLADAIVRRMEILGTGQVGSSLAETGVILPIEEDLS